MQAFNQQRLTCEYGSKLICVYILFTSQFYPWENWELLLCFSYPFCSGGLIINMKGYLL